MLNYSLQFTRIDNNVVYTIKVIKTNSESKNMKPVYPVKITEIETDRNCRMEGRYTLKKNVFVNV